MIDVEALAEDIRAARRVYICGNGGSAANAMHIANDLLACGIRAHALTADVATLTAIANDHGYENVFKRQLEVFGTHRDLLIALSGSGKSPNILAAVEYAENIGMKVRRIYGAEMGHSMQEAEEMQIKLGHQLRAILYDDPR